VKQRKHESAAVSFCHPVQSTGDSKQTIIFYYSLIVPIHPCLHSGAYSAPAGQNRTTEKLHRRVRKERREKRANKEGRRQ
jgi:hypothetical protein